MPGVPQLGDSTMMFILLCRTALILRNRKQKLVIEYIFWCLYKCACTLLYLYFCSRVVHLTLRYISYIVSCVYSVHVYKYMYMYNVMCIHIYVHTWCTRYISNVYRKSLWVEHSRDIAVLRQDASPTLQRMSSLRKWLDWYDLYFWNAAYCVIGTHFQSTGMSSTTITTEVTKLKEKLRVLEVRVMWMKLFPLN